MDRSLAHQRSTRWFAAAMVLTVLAYWPGLSGGWFFDDYPNIVRNADVQPQSFGIAELTTAALSSPSSELKRPLASLSFTLNHAFAGLDPRAWKITNLVIHLANGLLLWLLCLALLKAHARQFTPLARPQATALLIATGWLLLPVNLTAVLFVVQRMESLANLFVLLGLLGYTHARLRMLSAVDSRGLALAATSLVLPTAIGLLAKETAVLLPLYAGLVEAVLFRFSTADGRRDRRVVAMFVVLLVVPAVLGLALLAPWLLRDTTWAAREFTLGTRLLSEARIVTTYIGWTLLPLPQGLSFYHDHFEVSRSVVSPWSTLPAIAAILSMVAAAWWLRRRLPLASLGIALFLACHSLTGTVLPLELVYEHRNYFASFGVLLAVVPLLVAPAPEPARPRHLLLGLLMGWWILFTAFTAHAWGDPLRLASELAVRAPQSARAQFAHAQALLQASNYVPDSPLLAEAEAMLERASTMPGSSILPEQTLILTRSLMQRPIESRWWESLVAKLRSRTPDSEDLEALGSLTRCARDRRCELSRAHMAEAFAAAKAHGQAHPKLLAIHSDWTWSVLEDRVFGEQLARAAVAANPSDADARITLARMNIVLGRLDVARAQLEPIEQLNVGGRLDRELAELRRLTGAAVRPAGG